MNLILVCVYCSLRSLKIHHGIPYSCIGAKSETSIGRQPKQISWKSDLSIFMIGKTSSIRIQLHNIIPCFNSLIVPSGIFSLWICLCKFHQNMMLHQTFILGENTYLKEKPTNIYHQDIVRWHYLIIFFLCPNPISIAKLYIYSHYNIFSSLSSKYFSLIMRYVCL